ncbi:sigma-54 dependent transcriptional regulator [Methyloglobulus sp.]|uniref:sigma-54-dependent transcriptional regulator n=1 Tax=Methyloglobulus sp. TaxID=2518622 RepID=UPI0032B70F72
MKDTLLIIEDEALLGNELARFFRKQHWDVSVVTDLKSSKQLLTGQGIEPIVILSDMNLPDGNALDFLELIGSSLQHAEWIFLTGYGSVTDSVRALRLGAYDFIEKPCELDRLHMLVEGAARSARAQRRLQQETKQHFNRYTYDALVGRSQKTGQLREMLKQLANVPFSSLVLSGETGTGKGLVTRILHYSGSRASKPLVELNCAAIPKDLLESELFGYEAGAFTGAKKRHRGLLEQADTGTIFLDEIGELDLDLQGKLLKAVEELRFRRLGSESMVEVDVQIIAATNRDLLQKVKSGEFRQDLYHRLSVLNIHIPPLRERKEDLRDLVPQFVADCSIKSGKHIKTIPESVWEQLEAYDWPGNIRELHNVIERCVLFADSEVFPAQWLQFPNDSEDMSVAENEGMYIPLDGSLSLQDMEKHIIQEALHRANYNVTAAARMLGATRETMRYRVQKYHLKYDQD